jgi:hypothetical protein
MGLRAGLRSARGALPGNSRERCGGFVIRLHEDAIDASGKGGGENLSSARFPDRGSEEHKAAVPAGLGEKAVPFEIHPCAEEGDRLEPFFRTKTVRFSTSFVCRDRAREEEK